MADRANPGIASRVSDDVLQGVGKPGDRSAGVSRLERTRLPLDLLGIDVEELKKRTAA